MLTLQQQQYLCSGFGQPLDIPIVISGIISAFYVTWRACQSCGERNEMCNITKCAGILEDGQCGKEVCSNCTVAITEYNPLEYDGGVDYIIQMYHSEDCWIKMPYEDYFERKRYCSDEEYSDEENSEQEISEFSSSEEEYSATGSVFSTY